MDAPHLLFTAALAVVALGCLVPNRWLPPLPNDKFLHALAFGLLTLLALPLAQTPAQTAMYLLAVFGAGVAIEVLQILVPDRGFCWRDVAANTLGIALAAGGALMYAPLHEAAHAFP